MIRTLRIILFLAAALTLAGPAGAGNHDDARNAVEAGQALPLGAIVGQVSNRYPGKLLDADLRKRGGGMIYVLRWLTSEGNVLNVTVDAQSGRILGVKGQR